MKRIINFEDAASVAWYKDKGTFCKKDGTILKGAILDVESDQDDPDGIGWIGVETRPETHSGTAIYANEFAWAEFDD